MKNETVNSGYRLGLDIGGTKMCAVLLNGEHLVEHYRLSTPKEGPRHFWIMAVAVLKPLLERAKKDGKNIIGLGLGIAGTIDFRKQKITNSPNLPFLNGIKPLEKLTENLKPSYPLFLDNDANCFTRAEAVLGAGKKFNNIYGITIGTGIGGGLSLNGEIYQGAHGGAGEPGAMLVDLENKITLEDAYQKLTQNNSRILAQEAYEGDPLAEQIFQELGEYLGMIFANIVNIVDPGIIIIGGGTAAASDLFLSTAKQVMTEYIENPEARGIKIVKSKLCELTGAIGAALMVK